MILHGKFGNHLPLNRQSESFAREGIDLDVSTLADWVGACTATLAPLVELIRAHVFGAARIHGDDTTVPVLAKMKTRTGRLWTYVRDDRPFGGSSPPAAIFYYSSDREGVHPNRHLASYAGILQADAYGGYNDLYKADRRPGPITEAACWSHGRRIFVPARYHQGRGGAVSKETRFLVAAGARGGAPHRSDLRCRACPQRACRRQAPGAAPDPRRPAGRRSGELDARPSAPSSRVTTMSPRPWITCSSAGPPSRASSTMAESVSPTMRPSGRCAVSHSAAGTGHSAAPIAAASGRRRSTRSSPRQN